MLRHARGCARALRALRRDAGGDVSAARAPPAWVHACYTRSLSSAPAVPFLLDGQLRQSVTDTFVDVSDPATGTVVARTPVCTQDELAAAVASAARAAPGWRNTSVAVRRIRRLLGLTRRGDQHGVWCRDPRRCHLSTQARSRVMFKLAELVRSHTDELAGIITKEQGKTLADARGDVFRGLEVVEAACGVGNHLLGEHLENVSTDVDTYTLRQPLGVCAGICPFNFPAMIPLWMFPLALATGNTFVLKPSERVPSAAVRLAQLAMEAGVPPGVLNVVHGTHTAVNFLTSAPEIQAVSFVGGDAAGKHVAERCATHGKRFQCNQGAKNHAVVMPDAHPRATAAALVGAAFGAAGQRCMAVSVAVLVGDCSAVVAEVQALTRGLVLGHGGEEGTDVGPVISPASKARIEGLLASAVAQGATMAVDGAEAVAALPARLRGGNFVGPTVLTGITQGSPAYSTEVFGPVLLCMAAPTLEAALEIANASPYGNGAAIFTQSGAAARSFVSRVSCGQVGVNIPIPVAMPYFSFTGWKGSFNGNLHFYGKQGVDFFTRTKTVTTTWKATDSVKGKHKAQTSFPTSKPTV